MNKNFYRDVIFRLFAQGNWSVRYRRVAGWLVRFTRKLTPSWLRFHCNFQMTHFGKIRVWAQRDSGGFVRDYYRLCLDGLIRAGCRAGIELIVALSLPKESRLIPGGVRRVLLQVEHTLVKPTGIDSPRFPESTFEDLETGEPYGVRLDEAEVFAYASAVIEYSSPNLQNVLNSTIAGYYEDKSVYISPLVAPVMLNPAASGRLTSKAFTLMNLKATGDRRGGILVDIQSKSGIEIINLKGVTGDLADRYSKMGILLNLHQTNYHHTLEELRILPALLQGVIVISESSPAAELVPYHRFIYQATLDEIPKLIRDVSQNYQRYWEGLFSGPDFRNTVAALSEQNEAAFDLLISRLR